MKCLSRAMVLGLLLAGCAGKNPESNQALQAVVLISRSQEAFYVEQGRFTDRLADLRIDWLHLEQTTPNYRYQLRLIHAPNTKIAITLGINPQSEYLIGIASKASASSEIDKIFCRGKTEPPGVIAPNSCPPGFELLDPS